MIINQVPVGFAAFKVGTDLLGIFLKLLLETIFMEGSEYREDLGEGK